MRYVYVLLFEARSLRSGGKACATLICCVVDSRSLHLVAALRLDSFSGGLLYRSSFMPVLHFDSSRGRRGDKGRSVCFSGGHAYQETREINHGRQHQ